ncbi:hypothetical protein ABZ208_35545 [Streptomyces sp. NPDC006208]|uniref:hypothetical protein n=1 Tax=Streptomyces sp. NPDC006208 TaxID=3156734 RepID=UPI00339E4EE2
MTDAPRISVQAVDLGGLCPVALYDSREAVVLGIDMSRPAEEILTGLQDVIEEAVQSGRWTRNDAGGHRIGDGAPPGETARSHTDCP